MKVQEETSTRGSQGSRLAVMLPDLSRRRAADEGTTCTVIILTRGSQKPYTLAKTVKVRVWRLRGRMTSEFSAMCPAL